MRLDDETLLLLVVLGVLVLTSEPIEWGEASLWTFPVPDLDLDGVHYPAVISQEWRNPTHMGMDIMFRRQGEGDQSSYAPGSHDGTDTFFAPAGTPIVAARAGTVWSVDKSPRGIEVVIDHGKPFATYYQHLADVRVTKGQHVNAGDVIGVMGYDPLDPAQLRHLHFAVWFNGYGDHASVDAVAEMSSWQRATLPGEVLPGSIV